MLFQQILNKKHENLWAEFEKLYHLILANQTHDGDLLLVHLNGFYNAEVKTWDNLEEKMSPYVFGPSHEGHSEHTHYDFIGHYVMNNTIEEDREKYLEKFVYSEERKKEIDDLNFNESISIQTEMLIYLKIWESDMFIKKFYQLSNLLKKNAYDWHFSLMNSSRAGGKSLSRDNIIRKKIRDQFAQDVPNIAASFKRAYNVQIRNAIAHSQYSILGRNIQLNNYIKEDPFAQIRGLSFEDWTDIFHETIVLYTVYHKFLRQVNENYGTVAMQNNNVFPIRISREDPIPETQYMLLHYRDYFKDWGWQPDV